MKLIGTFEENEYSVRIIKDYAWPASLDGFQKNNLQYFIMGYNAPCVMPLEIVERRYSYYSPLSILPGFAVCHILSGDAQI